MEKAFKENVRNPKKIVIVGAGLAGLSSAYYLLKNSKKKLDITVLEASDNVGGRVKTMEFEGVRVDTGGFMIFKWYKNFFKLVSDLGLSNHVVPFKVNEYYKFDNKLVAYRNLPGCYLDKCKLICKSFPFLLIGKLNVYAPDLNLFKNKKVNDFVHQKSQLHKILSILVGGYTYPSINDWPVPLFLSMAWRMRLSGMFKHVWQFSGGTDILIRDLRQEIINYGGKIETNHRVTRYEKKTLITPKGKFESDVTIFASTLDHNLFEHIFGRKIDFFYTENRMMLVEFKKKIIIDKKTDWTIIYREKNESDHEIVSIVNIPQMINNLDSSFVVIYMSVKNCNDKCTSGDFLKIINKQAAEMFKNNRAVKIHYIENWDKTMPNITAESLDMIKKHEGRGNCYFIGDYMSWSSMEVAVGSGRKIANDILKKIK